MSAPCNAVEKMPLQPEADLKDEPHAVKDADDNGVVIFGSLINMRFREESVQIILPLRRRVCINLKMQLKNLPRT
jgi:hypothetical protein